MSRAGERRAGAGEEWCYYSPQHPVALVPSPPERQRLVLIEELLQVGGRGGMGGAEVEGAVPRVALWIVATDGRANKRWANKW